MAVTKEKKKVILSKLVDAFKDVKSLVFTQYSGLKVEEITELRKKLREVNAKLFVGKKTLFNIAAKDNGLSEIPKEIMAGPIAVAVSKEDEIAAAKAIYTLGKKFEAIKLKGAIIAGEVMDETMIIKLATLPSRQELYAKFIGSMKAPVSGFYGVLHNLLSGFVRVLDAKAKKS